MQRGIIGLAVPGFKPARHASARLLRSDLELNVIYEPSLLNPGEVERPC